jgi:collagenase-like PrtC family protease
MNIIVKPSQNDLSSYISKKITYFLLPLKNYSSESINSFSLTEIENIINKYPNIHVFISINKNIMNDEINPLKEQLLKLDKLNIEGVFYYDVCLIKLKKELNLSYDLVWDQSHMVTNYKTCDYYNQQGVKYALLSKEITKEEIIDIIKKSSINSIVELLSYPSVAFSKRKLVTNYYHDLGKNKTETLSIFEKVSNDHYLVNEEKSGTNFVKQSLLNGSIVLNDLLESGLSYILLREDFIDHSLFLEIIDSFSYFINNYKNMSEEEKKSWVEKQNQWLGEDFGFFFKKTIYRVKK